MRTTQASTVFDEASFIKLLGLERKRTDRSQRPFLLMLLDLRGLLREGKHQKTQLTSTITASLHDSARQTDVIGWYKANTVLGVIYTELSQPTPPVDKIVERTTAVLQGVLTSQQLHAIAIATYIYPPYKPDVAGTGPDEQIYADIKRSDLGSYLKRTLDIVGSLCLIGVLSPVFVLVGIAIKLTSYGPILFQQTRIGQFGKRFTFLKFRSMYMGTDSHVHQQYVQKFILLSKQGKDELEALRQDGFFKLNQDRRITPVGRVIRQTSLDELPQLFNVLAGSMSLVGPRPPIEYEITDYGIWHRRRVLDAKPGITGLWQVHGRSRTTFDDMVRLDLQYIDNWSFWTDLKLLLQTPWAVIKGEGAR